MTKIKDPSEKKLSTYCIANDIDDDAISQKKTQHSQQVQSHRLKHGSEMYHQGPTAKSQRVNETDLEAKGSSSIKSSHDLTLSFKPKEMFSSTQYDKNDEKDLNGKTQTELNKSAKLSKVSQVIGLSNLSEITDQDFELD